MLNFAPTEEQEEIRNLARSIAVEQLRPQGREAEQKGDISPELMQTLSQTGLTTPFPEEFGGSGAIEAMTYTLIAEELGFGDGALAMNIIGSLMGPLMYCWQEISPNSRSIYLHSVIHEACMSSEGAWLLPSAQVGTH